MWSVTFLSERISQIQEKQAGWHWRDPKREGRARLTLAHPIWAAKLRAAIGLPGSVSGCRNRETAPVQLDQRDRLTPTAAPTPARAFGLEPKLCKVVRAVPLQHLALGRGVRINAVTPGR